MRARARVSVAAGARLVELYGEVPLLPRRTGPDRVHFVGGAAGPLGGDDLHIDLHVGAGATLVVESVAATVALPGAGGAASRLTVSARVEAGGTLVYRPEPLIAAARCNHGTMSTVDLAADATLVWREELVCGRHGEAPGDARLSTRVSRAGEPLYVNDVAVGPAAGGWSGPAVLGGAKVYATILSTVEGKPLRPDRRTALLRLAGGAEVATALGDDLHEVRRRLEPYLASLPTGAGRS